MSPRTDPVHEALDRWERKGLLPRDTATLLREETEVEGARTGRRISQYALAATGGVILLVTVGVFADWLWPHMGPGTRSMIIALLGAGVHWLGLRAESDRGWRPAGYGLQTAGLLILLGAYIYSQERWANASPGGVVIGLLSLVTPFLVAPRALKRNTVMPAVHLALGFAYLAVFLDRATALSDDAIVWTLDSVMLVVAGLLILELIRSSDRYSASRALHAFVAALYSALVLLVFTGLGPLDLGEDMVWPVDAWLLVVVLMTLWGIHWAPRPIRRDWFERHLATCVLMGIILGFATGGTLDAPPEVTAFLVGGVGGLGLAYGVRRNAGSMIWASVLAVIVASWYYGMERAGALGAVPALALTAALLFWLSRRVGDVSP
jgi:Predicted membrane protein (DUF2157)